MKEHRDYVIIYHINQHYSDLLADLKQLDTLESFSNANERRRAILFDFLQIGELMNQLSDSFIEDFNNKNAYKIISIRNRIVHCYSKIRDDIIYNTLINNVPQFVKSLNEFARERYSKVVKSFIGKKIKVVVDRPIGFSHDGLEYPINYGYTEELTSLDGQFQDVYILGTNEPLQDCYGVVIAVVNRENDIEDKLVVSLSDEKYDEKTINDYVNFQEKFFSSIILVKKDN